VIGELPIPTEIHSSVIAHLLTPDSRKLPSSRSESPILQGKHCAWGRTIDINNNKLGTIIGLYAHRYYYCLLPQRTPLAPLWPFRARTWTKPSCITCRVAFPLTFHIVLEDKSLLFPIFLLLWAIFKICTSCCRVSTANTAQHGASSPAQSSKASTCRPERDNASKQAELARASMSSSIYTARCVLETNEEIEICPAKIYNHSQSSWSWCRARRTRLQLHAQSTLLFLSVLFYVFRTCMRRPGCFPAWSSYTCATRQFAVIYSSLWASVAGGIQPLAFIRKKKGTKIEHTIFF